MQLRHAANTDNGRARDHNEDAYAVDVSPEHAAAGALFVVCDGMGGFASGEVASELAVETIQTRYYAVDASDPQGALRNAFRDANERVYREGKGKMGTTGVAALFRDNAAFLANVGDSRAYVLRGGSIRQLTEDHSFVAEQVSAGVLTAEQARESSYRNIITRALGHRDAVDVDIFQFPLHLDDRILLCSDGLHGVVEPEELAEHAAKGVLKRSVDTLINLANERGGPDNITVVLIEVTELGEGGATQIKTERLPRAGNTTPNKTERLPRAGGTTGAMRPPASAAPSPQRPAQTRKPEPAPASRSSIVGMIFMILVALTLLGGLLCFGLTTGIATPTTPATPRIPPTLTPFGVPTPVSATAVSPTQAQPTTAPAATSIVVPTVTPEVATATSN